MAMSLIDGLHHVTAVSSSAQGNVDFFTRVMGLRLVKKTVNFDDPGTYHLYFGDHAGTPGTVLTFFPMEGLPRGRAGTGEASHTRFAVPPGSLAAWRDRLEAAGAPVTTVTRFDRPEIETGDPDGLALTLGEAPADVRAGPAAGPVPAAEAVKGFEGVTLAVADGGATREILTGLFGYRAVGREGARERFGRPGVAAGTVDLLVAPDGPEARPGTGRVHHVAFRVPDRAAQAQVRAALAGAGHAVTPPIDRSYFHAIYFRTPDGILFEVATDEPGFATDEPVDALGTGLMLPARHAHLRQRLEATLPALAV